MNNGRNIHVPYITFTTLNNWTILLLDITHWLANSTRELCTTVSADGSDRCIKIPDILSRLPKPIFFSIFTVRRFKFIFKKQLLGNISIM